MYAPEDTIVALATPPGRGGLAVVRLSGPRAVPLALEMLEGGRTLAPRRATLVRVAIPDPNPETIEAQRLDAGRPAHDEAVPVRLRDEAVATYFAAPASYTGEDLVELSLHGSPVLVNGVVAAAVAGGARLARAGEFTLRAFLNGRLDLTQAEAVQDLVNATTSAQARLAFDQLQGSVSERIGAIDRQVFELAAKLEASVDFPDEGYHFVESSEVVETLRRVAGEMEALLAGSRRGRLLREGATVAIVGRTNVGKSTLFNRLAGSERAIVTNVPGTTRDLLTDVVSLSGVPLTLVDTAGARDTEDPVEREGVSRAARAREAADLVVLVLDGSQPLGPEDAELLRLTRSQPRVVAVNKADLPQQASLPEGTSGEVVHLAALNGSGMDRLEGAMASLLAGYPQAEPVALSNVRHIALLEQAHQGLLEALGRIQGEIGQLPEEFILSEIQATRQALEEITGQRTTDDLLNEVFSRFCVGK